MADEKYEQCYGCWYLWYMQYVPGNPKQIDDILVPQIEEEIAELSKSLDRVQQYPETLLRGNRSVSGMSLYETGHAIQICVVRVMCLSDHSSVYMHACFQLFLLLTFMSTDNPH